MRSLAVSRDADGVVQVEMTRPLMDAPMIGELADTFESLGDSPEAKAIVLSGQGAVFSTGVDLRRVMRANQGRAEWSVADARAFARMLWLIESCPKPTIARVHGVVAGGGIGLVCACQFVVASDDASFAAIETAFGDIPAVIRPYLVSTVGKQQAQRLASSSTRVDAHQARTIGLVQTVVPRSELDAAAKALATFLGTVPMRQII
ncbi:MAG TPA: enoyl-CoA hydratase-related protein [Burkholderiaceae bacterium]|nr:enoyl-CoA hydratase-related protein [Burkholderiaceae bacterium]